MDHPGLWRLLFALTDGSEEAATAARGLLPPPTCLPFSRMRAIALGGRGTEAEEIHLATCKSCWSAVERVRETASHPTVAELYRAVSSPAPMVAVRAHLEQDNCRRCRELSNLLRAPAVSNRITGLAARVIERTATTGHSATAETGIAAVLKRWAPAAAILRMTPLPTGKAEPTVAQERRAGFLTEDAGQRQPVGFLGLEAVATLFPGRGGPRLQLEIATPPGSELQIVYLVMGAGTTVFEQLILPFRPGASRQTRVADILLPGGITGDMVPLLTSLTASDLGAAEVPLLQGSYQAARTVLASQRAWGKWAATARQTSAIHPAVATALIAIATDAPK